MEKKIATFQEENDINQEIKQETRNRIKVFFVLQNVAFSANFSNILINEKKMAKKRLDYSESRTLQRTIMFDDEKIEQIAQKVKDEIDSYHHVLFSPFYQKTTRFPANIVKCQFNRHNSDLYRFKSMASVRRKLSNKQSKAKKKKIISNRQMFDKQNCAFSVFSSGLINTTGATVKQDMVNILRVLQIFNSYLEI